MNLPPETYRKLAELAAPRTVELIGELALEEGRLTVEQLEACLEEQRSSPPADRPRLGELLVRHGHLTQGDLARLLERQEEEAGLRDPAWRYEIREILGRGGTSVVYRAWDRELRREVALKVVRRELMQNPEVVRRLLHEARIVAGLQHPSIVPVHDAGTRDGLVYIVMPVVEGRTLNRVVTESPFPLRRRMELLLQVAEAVHHAHSNGVIHRDLKPRNILVDASGRPHIMDFGLARLAGSQSVHTRSGAVIGTPLYMSPEQVRGAGDEVDARTDIYSLGVLLYELLTGTPPHDGESTAAIYHSILERDAEPPRKKNPSIPPDAEIICLKALERETNARYGTAEEFAADLGRCLRGEPIRARRSTWSYRFGRLLRRHPIQAAILASSTTLTLAMTFTTLFLLDPPSGDPTRDRKDLIRSAHLHRLSAISAHISAVDSDFRSGRTSPESAHRDLQRMIQELSLMSFEGDADPARLHVRAKASLAIHDLRAAETDLREAVRMDPRYGPALVLLGCVLAMKQPLRLPAAIGPEPPPGEEILDLLRRANAAGLSTRGIRETPRDRVPPLLIRALHALHVEKNASKAARILEDGLIRFRAEEYLVLLGRWEKDDLRRLSRVENALTLSPNHVPALLSRAETLTRLDRRTEAIEDYSKAIALAPLDPLPWAHRGLLHLSDKRFDEALADLQRAVKLDPSSLPLLDESIRKAQKADQ